jgi:hypothetical protein
VIAALRVIQEFLSSARIAQAHGAWRHNGDRLPDSNSWDSPLICSRQFGYCGRSTATLPLPSSHVHSPLLTALTTVCIFCSWFTQPRQLSRYTDQATSRTVWRLNPARRHRGASGTQSKFGTPPPRSCNSQNTKDKHAEQPSKQLATPYRIYVLPLLTF